MEDIAIDEGEKRKLMGMTRKEGGMVWTPVWSSSQLGPALPWGRELELVCKSV